MSKALSFFLIGAATSTAVMIFLDKTHYMDDIKREKNKIVQKVKAMSE